MSRLRWLITGVCGFTGRHLVARLRQGGAATIFGLDMPRKSDLPLEGYFPCDLTDAESLRQAIEIARPDVVIHLAGLMGTASAERMHQVNVGGFVSLCAALRQSRAGLLAPLRLVTIGSAAELGTAAVRRLPVLENVECVPESPYGRSKWEVTRLALSEPADSALEIVIARPFNLLGPGLGSQLALGNFIRQIAAVARGEAEAIHCGPLDARRDFIDVRDAVDAYVALAERGRPGQIYNVCSGRSYRIGDLLDRLIALAGVYARIETVAPLSPRAGDLPDVFGDHAKITCETGWHPERSIERSLADMWAAAATRDAAAA